MRVGTGGRVGFMVGSGEGCLGCLGWEGEECLGCEGGNRGEGW